MKVAYIFLNGKLKGRKSFYKNFLNKVNGDIYCADGGANISYFLEVKPLEIWGDLDSIEKNILDYYIEQKIIIKKFPVEKDKTDSELLLDYLKEKKYEKIYCIAGLGGDIDHELTNLTLCFKYKELYFLTEKESIFSISENHRFENLKNSSISFVIFSDKIENLTLKGFKYNVKNLTLQCGDSRCISNIISENNAKISFTNGRLLCILKNNSE